MRFHFIAVCFYFVLGTSMMIQSSSAVAKERLPDFGTQWVRSRPMTVMGLCLIEKKFELKQYQQVGFNTVLAWKPRTAILGQSSEADFPWFGHLYTKDKKEFTEKFQEKFRQLKGQYQSDVGWIVNDEPNHEQMKATGEALRWIRKNYPNQLVLSNAYPGGASSKEYLGQSKIDNYRYGDYIRDLLRIVHPDVLMVDIYPFSRSVGSGVSSEYYRTLMVIREEALRARVPYWTFVQSYEHTNRRLPSESDLRMQVFSSLTFGFTGIAYFTYDATFQRGLVEPDGQPSILFDSAAQVNAEAIHLGQALRFLHSTGVQFVSSSDALEGPAGMKLWRKEADTKLRDITIVDPQKSDAGLIGFFADDQGQNYFMLTNLNQHSDKNAEECESNFTIHFAPNIKMLSRLNRETGQSESLSIDDPEKGLTITLPGGTGDLFKYGTDPFVGLP